jgi:hypothetical protein
MVTKKKNRNIVKKSRKVMRGGSKRVKQVSKSVNTRTAKQRVKNAKHALSTHYKAAEIFQKLNTSSSVDRQRIEEQARVANATRQKLGYKNLRAEPLYVDFTNLSKNSSSDESSDESHPKTSLGKFFKKKFGRKPGTPTPDNGYSNRSSISSLEPSGSNMSRSSSGSSIGSIGTRSSSGSSIGSTGSRLSAEEEFIADMARSPKNKYPQQKMTQRNMTHLGMTPKQIEIVTERQKMFTQPTATAATAVTAPTSTTKSGEPKKSSLANKIADAIAATGETPVGGYINKLSKKNLKKN